MPTRIESGSGKSGVYLQSIPGLTRFSAATVPGDLACLVPANQAILDAVYVFTTYWPSTNGTLDSTYFGLHTDGPPVIPFTFPFTQTWASLLAQPVPVTVFSGSRSGGGVDTVTAIISVTSPTVQALPVCRTCVFQTMGGWAGCTVVLPGGATASATKMVGGESDGFWYAVFILVNDQGVITGEFVT